VLPDVIADVAADVVPCVFHSHAIYQMSKEWRTDFTNRLAEIGATRDLAHVSLEWLGDDPGPKLHFTAYGPGEDRATTPVHLADAHHHGRTLNWFADSDGSR
jgi:hypothetical protein